LFGTFGVTEFASPGFDMALCTEFGRMACTGCSNVPLHTPLSSRHLVLLDNVVSEPLEIETATFEQAYFALLSELLSDSLLQVMKNKD